MLIPAGSRATIRRLSVQLDWGPYKYKLMYLL